MQHTTHLLPPDKKPTTAQSTNTTKVQLGDPKRFTGVSYRNMDEGSLTEAEVTLKTAA